MRQGWLTAAMLAVALHCYHLHDARGVFQRVAIVDEDAWRFDLYDAQGRLTESGDADALLATLMRLGIVIPSFGRATRC